jgi:hypothetical protein
MRIKTRLEKLEENNKRDNFCACPDTPKNEVHYPDEEVVLIPDTCDKCGRKIDKTIIQIEYIK